jgi:hypothetical protein
MQDEEWDMESPFAKKELGRREQSLYDYMHRGIDRDFPTIAAHNHRFEVRSRGVLVGVHPSAEEAEEQVQKILRLRKKSRRTAEKTTAYAQTLVLHGREGIADRRAARVGGLLDDVPAKTITNALMFGSLGLLALTLYSAYYINYTNKPLFFGVTRRRR